MEFNEFLRRYRWRCISLWWCMQGMIFLSLATQEGYTFFAGLFVLLLSIILYLNKLNSLRVLICILLLLVLLLLFSQSFMLKWFEGTLMFKIFYLFLETITLAVTLYGIINAAKALR